MATFKIYYNPKNVNKENKFVIYIVVRHKGRQAYINSGLSAHISTLDKKGALDMDTLLASARFMEVLDRRFKKIAIAAEAFDVKDLAKAISKETDEVSRIDFYEFISDRISDYERDGRKSTAASFRVLLNHLRRYRTVLFADEITLERLDDFREFLKRPERIHVRNSRGVDYVRDSNGLSNNSCISIMNRFRTVFHAYRRRCPRDRRPEDVFENFEFGKIKEPVSRSLSREELRKIINCNADLKYPIARECFLLSLFFCGINIIDVFKTARIEEGRLVYNRSKTRRRRADDAYISMAIPVEAKQLLAKYTRDDKFILSEIYKNPHSIDTMFGKGFREMYELLEISRFTYYSARHSVATIMSNELDIPDSHIKMVLNHHMGLGATNAYIKKDFSKVDRANRKFLDYLFKEEYESLI